MVEHQKTLKPLKPMREGIIADYLAAEEMLKKYFISKSLLNKNLLALD